LLKKGEGPLDNKLQHIYNVIMISVSFSWDDLKNKGKQKKHRLSFDEALPADSLALRLKSALKKN
jgi:hypothetical protein